jgi:outer membrane receptor protein involved in Fe transport
LGLSYTGWSIANATTLVGGTPQNLKGRKLPNSPDLTASLGVEYEFRIDDSWRLTPRYDIYYQDKSYSRVFNSSHDQLKAYDISNLSVLLANRDWDFNMQFYVKNLFDKRYIQDTYLTDASSGLFTNLFVGDPRTYGVAITKRF